MPNPQKLRKALPLTALLGLSELCPSANSAHSKFFSQPPAKALPGLTDVVTKCNTFVEVKFIAHSRTEFVEGSESRHWKSGFSSAMVLTVIWSFGAPNHRQVRGWKNINR